MEMVTRVNSPQLFYCIGARTGVAISPIATEYADQPFVSGVPEGKSYPAPLVCSGIFHSMFST